MKTTAEFRKTIVELGFHEKGGDRDPNTDESIYNLALLGKKLLILKVVICDDSRYAAVDRRVDVRYLDPEQVIDIARATFHTSGHPDAYEHALDFLRSYMPKTKSPNVEAALRHLRDAKGEWIAPPPPTRVGRRKSRPHLAYWTLVKQGLAQNDGHGKFREYNTQFNSTD